MKVQIYDSKDMEKERKKTTNDVIAYMLHIVCWYLHDELGYGTVRLSNALAWMNKRIGDFMSNGEVSLTDVHQMLLDECRINIHFDKERMR